MFERFTERARRVVVLAQEEARTLAHSHIGTEHMLLGLLRVEAGVGGRVLRGLDITADRVRAQVVQIVDPGEEVASGQIPFTPRARTVPELALRESLSLGHNYIGTEHILLALVREGEGGAIALLLDCGADADKIRKSVLRMLTGPDVPGVDRPAEATAAWGPPVEPSRWDVLVDGAGTPLQTLVRDIEHRLGRWADAGDLLVVLASIPDGVGQRALEALGVHADALARAVEEARSSERRSSLLFAPELVAPIEQARALKRTAIQANRFEQAAEFRDRERELLAAALETVKPRQDQLLTQLRARLGLKSAQQSQRA